MAALPVLYSFRRCPYAMRARLALAVSGVRCEIREVVLRNKPAALLAASPKGTVPVLITEAGAVLDQSLDIMLWALAHHDPQHWLAPQYGSVDDMLSLVAANDGDFKFNLDRYKYPQRYPGVEAPPAHRLSASAFLLRLEQYLQENAYLFGAHATLADMAIFPFVRQFAHTDKVWFAAQKWPRLQAWLDELTQSALYATVMTPYAPWQEAAGQAAVLFPPPAESAAL
jgi:glutathione S-transferase